MKPPKFTAKPEKSPKFRDLSESYDDTYPKATRAMPKKSYPGLHLHHKIKGLDKIGAKKTVRMKVRVTSMEHREGERPHIGLDVHGIEE